MTPHDRPEHLDVQAAFDRLATLPLASQTLHSVLQTVADLATQVMTAPVEASVTVLVADRPTTFVHTDRLALDLDESQYGRGHGPCLHAASRAETVAVTDTRT